MFDKHLETLMRTRVAIEDACADKSANEDCLRNVRSSIDSFRKDKKAWTGLAAHYNDSGQGKKGSGKKRGRAD